MTPEQFLYWGERGPVSRLVDPVGGKSQLERVYYVPDDFNEPGWMMERSVLQVESLSVGEPDHMGNCVSKLGLGEHACHSVSTLHSGNRPEGGQPSGVQERTVDGALLDHVLRNQGLWLNLLGRRP